MSQSSDKVVMFRKTRSRIVGDEPLDIAGSGGDDGGMESRLAKLEAVAESTDRRLGTIESDLREIRREARTDFRSNFAALILVAIGLATIMAKGFHWL